MTKNSQEDENSGRCSPDSPRRYEIRRVTSHVVWSGGPLGVLAVAFDRAQGEEFDLFLSEDQLRESRDMNNGRPRQEIDNALRAIESEVQKRHPGLYGPLSVFRRGPGH